MAVEKRDKSYFAGTFLSLIFLILLICASNAGAFDLQGLPGSTWGEFTHDADGISGSGAMGYVNQGINWVKLPEDITFNTFAEYRLRQRTRNKTFYDTEGPALGIELKKSYFKLGADYYWERFTKLNQTSEDREIYFTWFYDWDLGRALRAAPSGILGLPGSTWGQLTSSNGVNGNSALGYVNQGIDWFKLPGAVTLNTFAEYRFQFSTKNRTFYDAEGPALGIELKKWFLRAGADYYWERYPALKRNSDHMQYYVTWYYAWDLKNLKSASNQAGSEVRP